MTEKKSNIEWDIFGGVFFSLLAIACAVYAAWNIWPDSHQIVMPIVIGVFSIAAAVTLLIKD